MLSAILSSRLPVGNLTEDLLSFNFNMLYLWETGDAQEGKADEHCLIKGLTSPKSSTTMIIYHDFLISLALLRKIIHNLTHKT